MLCGCFIGTIKTGLEREIENLLNHKVLVESVFGNWRTWLGVVLGGALAWKIQQLHSTYLQGSFFGKEIQKETKRIFIVNKEPEQFGEAIKQSQRFWMLLFILPAVFANLNLALFIEAKSVFSLGMGLILTVRAILLFPTKSRLIEMAEERLTLLRIVNERILDKQ